MRFLLDFILRFLLDFLLEERLGEISSFLTAMETVTDENIKNATEKIGNIDTMTLAEIRNKFNELATQEKELATQEKELENDKDIKEGGMQSGGELGFLSKLACALLAIKLLATIFPQFQEAIDRIRDAMTESGDQIYDDYVDTGYISDPY